MMKVCEQMQLLRHLLDKKIFPGKITLKCLKKIKSGQCGFVEHGLNIRELNGV